MTQEEKELLLQDLCARLPYGVKIWYKYYPDKITEQFATSIRLVDGKIALSRKFDREGDWHPIEEANELLIKPYLRPMSSMTREELNTYARLVGSVSYSLSLEKIVNYKKVDMDDFTFLSNWLNKNMFDYRGLIPMGLALEALEGMYKNETI